MNYTIKKATSTQGHSIYRVFLGRKKLTTEFTLEAAQTFIKAEEAQK